MTVVIALVVGFLAGRLVWLLLLPALEEGGAFIRRNYRARLVVTGSGVVLPVVLAVVEATRLVLDRAGLGHGDEPRLAVAAVVAATGFGLFGLIDDLAGQGESGGFTGHAAALGTGRLSSGGLKVLAGAAVAVTAVALAHDSSTGRLLADAALVALAANLGNLLDRAPGRVIKTGGLAFVALAAATSLASGLGPVALVVGAMLALALEDLHERAMLGDAGANVVGALLALGVVAVCSPTVRLAVLAVVLVLNLVSEWVSFSEVIDAVPPLRALDRAGRRA